MSPRFAHFSVRRIVMFLAAAVMVYLMIGNTLMPARLSSAKPRDLLSVEQHQSVAQQAAVVDAARNNEDALEELVLLNGDSVKERIRSPDPNLHRGNASGVAIAPEVVHNEEFLTSDVSKLESVQAEALQHNQSLCPDIADNKLLVGPLTQAVLLITNLKEAEVLSHYPFLQRGGRWKPEHCVPRYKVAIIVPFRDRQTHLTRLIDFIVPVLKRQLLDFRFIVTEQYGQDLFNKGRIMNAAFRLAERLGVDCVIFHDVDMFPQDDRNSYGCPSSPRHIGAFVSNLGYQLWYKEIVGGVLAISMDDYRAVNGYSNLYWAWGGEDDDMGKRILSQNMTIERPEPAVGRFSMLKHVKRKRTAPKLIYKLLDTADTRWETDGLNVTSWKVIKESSRPLYYHIYVDVGNPPEEWRSES